MLNIKAEMRNLHGKSISRRLRAANKFPAIIYGGKLAPVLITLDHEQVWNLHTQSAFYNSILTITIGEIKEKVKVQAVQRHVFKPKFIHIDFVRIECD